MKNEIQGIKFMLSEGELFAQLAEEASELAKAALKLRRVLDKTNPTPVSLGEAQDNMVEEIADVLLCLHVMGYDPDSTKYLFMMQDKAEQWVKRLEDARKGNQDHGRN